MLAEFLQASGAIPAGSTSQIMVKNVENLSSNDGNLITEDTPVLIEPSYESQTDTELQGLIKLPNKINENHSSSLAKVPIYLNPPVDNKYNIINKNLSVGKAKKNIIISSIQIIKPATDPKLASTDWEAELDNATKSVSESICSKDISSSELVINPKNKTTKRIAKGEITNCKTKANVVIRENSDIFPKDRGNYLEDHDSPGIALDDALNMLEQGDIHEQEVSSNHVQGNSSLSNNQITIHKQHTAESSETVIKSISNSPNTNSSELLRILNDPVQSSDSCISSKSDIFSRAIASADLNLDSFEYYQDEDPERYEISTTAHNDNHSVIDKVEKKRLHTENTNHFNDSKQENTIVFESLKHISNNCKRVSVDVDKNSLPNEEEYLFDEPERADSKHNIRGSNEICEEIKELLKESTSFIETNAVDSISSSMDKSFN